MRCPSNFSDLSVVGLVLDFKLRLSRSLAGSADHVIALVLI